MSSVATLPLPPPQEVMAHHAKTFHWANRLMPAAYRADFAVLYAFCRLADDAVDEADSAEMAAAAIEKLQLDLDRNSSDHPHVTQFLQMAERRSVPLDIPRELLVGIESDVDSVRIETVEDLHRYCYRVASTVGLMVCHILDVRQSEVLAFAIDLGMGMQMTNISRDVVEDFGNDKIYIPAESCDHKDIATAVQQDDSAARETVYCAILQLLDRADDYYRSADQGMRYLPAWARWGILTASRCYQDIGHVIRGRGDRYWLGRSATTKGRKLARTAGTALAVAARPRYWSISKDVRHEAALHAHLAGLPHATP